MIVGTILLDSEDKYTDEVGNMPTSPAMNKVWLKALVKDEIISTQAYGILPKSISKVAKAVTNETEPTTPITIEEIDALSDILIVVRSLSLLENGKKFRFDNFSPVFKTELIEIWVRKNRIGD